MVYKSIDHTKVLSIVACNWKICLTAESGSFLNSGWVVNILVIISTDSDSFDALMHLCGEFLLDWRPRFTVYS